MVSHMLILDQLGDGMLGHLICIFLVFSLLIFFKTLSAALYFFLTLLFVVPIIAIIVLVIVLVVAVLVVLIVLL